MTIWEDVGWRGPIARGVHMTRWNNTDLVATGRVRLQVFSDHTHSTSRWVEEWADELAEWPLIRQVPLDEQDVIAWNALRFERRLARLGL